MGVDATTQGNGADNSFLSAYQAQIKTLESSPGADAAYDQGLNQELAAVWQSVTGSAPPPGGAAPGAPTSPPDMSSSGIRVVSGGSGGGTGAVPGSFSNADQSGPMSPQETQQMAQGLASMLMKNYGLTQNQASGVIASLMLESGLNTGIEQGGTYNTAPTMANDTPNQTGYGLAQWGESRKQDLLNYASQHGLPPSSQAAQVGFMMQELNGPYSSVISAITSGPDSADAACQVWTTQYEAASEPNMQSRLDNIAQVQSMLS